jgi:hypothetical protein
MGRRIPPLVGDVDIFSPTIAEGIERTREFGGHEGVI